MTSVPDIKLIRTDTFLLRGRISQHSLHLWMVCDKVFYRDSSAPRRGYAQGRTFLYYFFLLQTMPQGPFLAEIRLRDYDAFARRLLNTTFAFRTPTAAPDFSGTAGVG